MRIAMLHRSEGAETVRELQRELASTGHELEAAKLETARERELLEWADCVFVVAEGAAARRVARDAAERGRPCVPLPTMDAAGVYRGLVALKALAQCVPAPRLRRPNAR